MYDLRREFRLANYNYGGYKLIGKCMYVSCLIIKYYVTTLNVAAVSEAWPWCCNTPNRRANDMPSDLDRSVLASPYVHLFTPTHTPKVRSNSSFNAIPFPRNRLNDYVSKLERSLSRRVTSRLWMLR